jgi:predicted nucleotide-binding protein
VARRASPPPPQRVQLSPAEMKTAIDRFNRRLADLDQFDPDTIRDRSDPRIPALQASIGEALSEAFGHNTPEYNRYSAATSLDTAPLFIGPAPLAVVVEGLHKGKARATALLKQAIRSLEERLLDIGNATPVPTTEISDDVFIVHGRDSPARTEVAHVIERAGLNAVILHEQPNAGQTIIEKFERHGGSAGFAVVLLTPDDVGGPTADKLQPRARQNVIGEMFWFAGKLGRNRVCALKKGNLELPSDFAGVGYTEMNDGGAWKAELLKELEAAGYTVDWRKALA